MYICDFMCSVHRDVVIGLFRASHWVATASDAPAAIVGFALDRWWLCKTSKF